MKGGKGNRGSGNLGAHLVLALTRLEVKIGNIHLLEAERTLLCILHRTKDKKYVINWVRTVMDVFLDRTSSSLQYASCTPVRTEDFAWSDAPAWATDVRRDEWSLTEDMVNAAEVTAEITKVKEKERQRNSDNEVMCPFLPTL
jgi:hypothetical protein